MGRQPDGEPGFWGCRDSWRLEWELGLELGLEPGLMLQELEPDNWFRYTLKQALPQVTDKVTYDKIPEVL